MNKNKRYNFLIAMLALGVMAFLGLHYFVFKDIKQKNQNTSGLNQQLAFQVDKHTYLISTQRTIQNLSGEIELIDNSIVGRENEVEFLEEIEGLARGNGLSIAIDSISLDESLKSDQAALLKIKLKTSGAWAGTYKFLAGLESLKYKIKIDALSLVNATNPEGGATGSVWQASFDIKVLKYK